MKRFVTRFIMTRPNLTNIPITVSVEVPCSALGVVLLYQCANDNVDMFLDDVTV